MTLIFNLPGAVQEVRGSKTNKEKIEALNRFTEEFYRTIGILFYTRYLTICNENQKPIDDDIRVIIRDYFKAPTFDSWMRIGKLCVEHLYALGDRFALEFNKMAMQELEPSETIIAKKILKEIHSLRSSIDYSPPKKITYIQVLDVMRLLRNFRSHEWDNNPTLKPLLGLEVEDFIVSLVDKLMNNINISLLTPLSIRINAVECAEQCCTQKRIVNISSSSNAPPSLSESYILYYKDEPEFRFKTSLIKYYEEFNRCYVYLKYKEDDKDALFESVPVVGQIEKIGIEFHSLDEIFGLSKEDLESIGIEQTLEQKFGRIEINNGKIHNLPELIEDYVPREKVEQQLIEKLSHRRLYLTTIDGGGGFGKTELAKKVIWSIITSENKNDLPRSLQFKYIVWVTGKVEYFREGNIDTKKQTFKTVEDLIDSILYVTGNTNKVTKNFEEKKKFVTNVLNDSPSTLLLLDNLETVTEKDTVWKYIIELGDAINTELKVLVTSRTRGGSAEQRLNVRAMEPDEAKRLACSEMKRLDVHEKYQSDDNIDLLIKATGSVPLLIRYSINLISRGYNLNEISKVE